MSADSISTTTNNIEWLSSIVALAHDPTAIIFIVLAVCFTVTILVILNHFFDIQFYSVKGQVWPGYKFQRRRNKQDEIPDENDESDEAEEVSLPETPQEVPMPPVQQPAMYSPVVENMMTPCNPGDCKFRGFFDDNHKKAILSEHEVSLYNQISYDVIRQMTIDELITTTLFQMNKVERGFRKIVAYFTAEYGAILRKTLSDTDYVGAISQHGDYKNYLNLIELSFNINVKSGIRYALNNNHIPNPDDKQEFNTYISELVDGLFHEHILFMDDRYTSMIVIRDIERDIVIAAMDSGVLHKYLSEVIAAAVKERIRIEHKIERMMRDMKREQAIILYSGGHSESSYIEISGTADSKESMDTLRVKYNVNVGV